MKQYYVYILTNTYNNVFYTGVTGNLVQRIYRHINKVSEGFSKQYNTFKLVYYEIYDDVSKAIYREKQLKKWRKEWKIDLIKKENENFKNLAKDWF